MAHKIERIESQVKKEIGTILANEARNQMFKKAFVTEAKVSSDLSHAKIYVTVIDHGLKDTVISELNEASGFIRTELAKVLDIRHTPELKFVYDDSIEYGERIEKLIKESNEK